MIRRLTLQNWRNYEDITLDLSLGTTFIVAPNGIGKTSLMEAAAWAVFGDSGQRLNGAVRVGNSSATATAEVELPDHRVIRISRTLPKRPGARLPRPAITINGAEIDEPQAISELRHSYGADPGFLLRLAMPRGRIDGSSPSDLGLHDHLCRIFGAEGLLKAIENLDQRIKRQEKLIKAAKQGRPADAATVSALQRRATQAEAAVQAASSSHDRVARMLDQAREAERFRKRLDEWRQNAAAYTQELTRLAAIAGPDVRLDPQEPESVQTALDTALSNLQAELEGSRVRQAELRGRATAVGQHSQSLQSAPDDCPVCRRPLDAETISNAKSAHAAELAQIAAETEQLRSAETRAIARQRHVSMLIEHFRSMRHPGPRPTPGEVMDYATGTSLEKLEAERRQSLDQLVTHRTAAERARQDLDTILQDEIAQNRLERLYAEEAVLRTARAAISAAATQLLDGTIRPIEAEMNARWPVMFPGRGQLRTQSNGDVTRDLNGEYLPYSAFSTGERAGFMILLRLRVLEASTKADFCWFDEPLEHLDPDARRNAAEVLARASNTGGLRQIVVSTYEEPLARRLQERDPDNVKLIYVRQGSN